MDITDLKDDRDRRLVAATVLSYHEKTRGLQYDSAREEFSVLGLGSGPEHMLIRDALMSLGATDARTGGGSVVVRNHEGARSVAANVKAIGIKFAGIDSLPNQMQSR